MSGPTDDDKDEVFLSCRYGDLEDVQRFVERFGAESLADIRDANGSTVLHMICANGHSDVLSYLLFRVPSSLLAIQNNSGSTALHWAALNSHLECAQKLVQLPRGPGIDLIDIKNSAGRSPLAEAEFSGWDEGARWMVEVMNLDIGEEVKEQDGKPSEESGDDPVPRIEVEIQDAEGKIAKMSIGGKEI